MKQYVVGIFLFLLLGSAANAALLSRNGGYAYYDNVLDVTWLADANYAQTSGYDVDGRMSWADAQTWIGTLNSANNLGVNDWRLPTATDTGIPGCNFAYFGTDCGYNVDLSTGEMAHMFYSTLGNTSAYGTSGVATGCAFGGEPYCLTNPGPFLNVQTGSYWSGIEYANITSNAWDFYFDTGIQTTDNKSNGNYAWAVRSGDIAVVPVPAAAWLFGGALGLLGMMKRRSAA